MTILFIAPNPRDGLRSDGYRQRISAIERVFAEAEVIYYDDVCIRREDLVKALCKADIVYIHSIYQAQRILSHLPDIAHRTILDIHGAVPEELELMGNMRQCKEVRPVEAKVFARCKHFVAVSQAMVDFYHTKFGSSGSAKWVVLPIFDVGTRSQASSAKVPNTIVYAGGVQRWQNVDKMIEAINASPENFKFEILTHSPDSFASVAHLKNRVSIRHVAGNAVSEYYRKSSMGFIFAR